MYFFDILMQVNDATAEIKLKQQKLLKLSINLSRLVTHLRNKYLMEKFQN